MPEEVVPPQRDAPEELALNRAELQRVREVATDVRGERIELERRFDIAEGDLRETLERVKELRHEKALVQRELRDAKSSNENLLHKVHQLEPENRNLRQHAENLQRAYDRLRNRRLVRIALAIAALFQPLFGAVRALRGGGRTPPPLKADEGPRYRAPMDHDERTEIGERALRHLLERTVEVPRSTTGPKVSIVVLNRDGLHHLRRLLPGLEKTDYEPFEVVVVDNDSGDGSRAYLARYGASFPLQVLENDENASFSAGNMQGVQASDGELVLLLNNDIEPITPGWLARMVETLQREGAGAVGARLLYPHRPDLDNVGDTVHDDLTVQHRGIHFAHGKDAFPLPRNVGSGEEPVTAAAETVTDVPAVTAACLLVRRDVLEEAGGLHPDYRYGTEDVDLCLAIRAAGHRIIYDGQAALWHHEFGTQNQEGRDFKAENRRHNRRVLTGRWGPQLHRQVLADRVRAERFWSHAPLRLVELGEARDGSPLSVAGLGWETVEVGSSADGSPDVPAEVDVVVVRSPDVDVRALTRGPVLVGLPEAGTEDEWLAQGWFDDLDIVLAASDRAAEELRRRSMKAPGALLDGIDTATLLRDAVLRWLEATRYSVLIATPGWDVAESWGDTHYGRGLQRWLERAGHPTRLVLRHDFDSPWAAQADVAVHLLGLTLHEPNPGQVNVLWNISHPELVEPEIVAGYDRAFVASRQLAAELDAQVDIPVAALSQATDADRFRVTPGGPHHELLFVANSRRQRRRIVDDLTPTEHDLAIYGNDWFEELVHPSHVRGEVVANEELPAWYAAADIVLNDHWPEMLEHGFISNRLYDVLAAGGFVISDPVEGIEEEFDGGVVTYADRADLLAKVRHYLEDPQARREHVERGRRAVLGRHTFAHRARSIAEEVASLVRERPRWVVPPSAESAPALTSPPAPVA